LRGIALGIGSVWRINYFSLCLVSFLEILPDGLVGGAAVVAGQKKKKNKKKLM